MEAHLHFVSYLDIEMTKIVEIILIHGWQQAPV